MPLELVFVATTLEWSEISARSCAPLRSHVPCSSIFPSHSAFLRSCTTFFSRSPVLHSECVGVGEQLITLTLCVYGWIRRAGSTRHRTTTPHVTRARCMSLLGGSQFGVKLLSHPQSPLPPLLSVHVITVSSLHRNANLAFLFFPVPILSRSYSFAFRVPV